MSAAARAVFTACGVFDRGIETVDRAGLVHRAADPPRYTRLTKATPDVTQRANQPAWVVQFIGELPELLEGESWIDATCVVFGHTPGFYATGPVRDLASGKIKSGYYPASPGPTLSLPTLAP